MHHSFGVPSYSSKSQGRKTLTKVMWNAHTEMLSSSCKKWSCIQYSGSSFFFNQNTFVIQSSLRQLLVKFLVDFGRLYSNLRRGASFSARVHVRPANRKEGTDQESIQHHENTHI